MKQQTLLSRLLLPVLVVLLLLPPLSCLIFQQAAARYAYGEASGDLEDLQQNILPLMENAFEHQASTPEEALEQVGTFLRQAGPMAHRMGGRANLMILGGRRSPGGGVVPVDPVRGTVPGDGIGVDGWLWRNLVGTGL